MGVGVVIVGGVWEISTASHATEIISSPAPFSQSDRAIIYDLVSRYRLGQGLQPLSVSYKLEKAATAKAQDMYTRGYWDHDGPDGSKPWVFLQAVSYDYKYAGENLAKDFSSASELVDAWKLSKGHNDNLLKKEYTESGIGYICYDTPYSGCSVVMFYGTPSN